MSNMETNLCKKAEDIYPVTIVMDRYNGCASGGRYLAFNLDSWDIPDEIEECDAIADEYWRTTTEPIGRGNTPEEALQDLLWRLNEFLFQSHLEQELEKRPTQEWHQASDQPENKDGWFLALTKDNLPFLTHYLNGWLPQVDKWMYISIPRKA